MRLIDLEPEWCTVSPNGLRRDEELTLATAQGVMFLCPRCFKKNNGRVGTHSILAWFRDRGVPDDKTPGPGRWTPSGTGFEDLTLSPSIDLTKENQPGEWHGHIINGEIVGGLP